MPETRIALIMGGGVSLGSFSGGALAQIVQLLKHVQRGPAKIDVMSGASAGSMTLAVVAHHLFMGASDEQIAEALYSAWVEQIDLEKLVPGNFSEHEAASLFSNKIIREIALNTIQTDKWAEPADLAHALFAEGMKVSFSLTNLNGIPVRSEGQMIRQSVSGGGPATGENSVFADALQTTFHNDVIRFELRRDEASFGSHSDDIRILQPWNSKERRTSWNVFRKAAIASGAFPGAFPPSQLMRSKNEYGEYWPRELEDGTFRFDYLDGGITRNEPLREAIELASRQDEGEDVERVFILVDPGVSGTDEMYPLPFNQPLSLNQEYDDKGNLTSMSLKKSDYLDGLGSVVGRFASVLKSQATYRDWLKAARYNSQIEWKDDLMGLLDEVKPISGSNIDDDIDNILNKIYREKKARSSPKELTSEELGQIPAEIRRDIKKQSANGDEDDFSAKLKLLVNLVANLKGKRKLNFVAVTPASLIGGADHRLAGNFMTSFGGFFEKKYRDHDYTVGEHVAAHVLCAPVKNEEGEAKRFLKEEAEIPEGPEPIVPDPAFKNVNRPKQEIMEGFLKNHLDNFVSSFPIPTKILRRFVRNKIAQKLSKSLMAESGGQIQYIYVRFENVDSNWRLKGSAGEDVKVSNNTVAETIIGVRKSREGAIQFEMFGPHLQQVEEGKKHEFQFYRKSRWPWKSDQIKKRISVEGEYNDWFKKACYNCVPDLVYSLNNETSDSLRPGDVCAHQPIEEG